MRLHRFYISDKLTGPTGDKIGAQKEFSVYSSELVNQIRRVFRLKNGDTVILFDGSGYDYECRIVTSDSKSERVKSSNKVTDSKDGITFQVISSTRSHFMPARDIYLCAAITKKDTFEWIVEKATELGVTHIVPVLAERSEKKSLNEERLCKIAIEASEQSGRGGVPQILPITKLDDVITLTSSLDGTKAIVFHTEGEVLNKSDTLANEGISGEIQPTYVFIGPEGGWSQSELDMFHSNKMSIKCLGNQVLRAETAVVAALSMVVFSK